MSPPPGQHGPEQRSCRLHHQVGCLRMATVEEQLPGTQAHGERGREKGGGNGSHWRPSSPDDEEADRDERQEVNDNGLPLPPPEWREWRYMIREVQVSRRDGQLTWPDVVDGMARCAYLGLPDLALPGTTSMDFPAEGNLPRGPGPQGIPAAARPAGACR